MAALITVEDAAALLPIRAGNTDYDAKLRLLIASASAQIEQVIRRELLKKERTEEFNSPATQQIFYDFTNASNELGQISSPRNIRYTLKAFNIDLVQPFVVRYDPARIFGDDTIVPATSYVLDAANGILQLKHPMVEGIGTIHVTYTGGYAASVEGDLSATIPSEIKMACLAQVLHLFGKFTAENIGKVSDTTEGKSGGNQFASKAGLVPEALALIYRYKAFGLGIY